MLGEYMQYNQVGGVVLLMPGPRLARATQRSIGGKGQGRNYIYFIFLPEGSGQFLQVLQYHYDILALGTLTKHFKVLHISHTQPQNTAIDNAYILFDKTVNLHFF